MSNPYIPPTEQPPADAGWTPPGGDIPLDELFADPGQPTTANPSPSQSAETTPQTYAYTYKTREEAERGIAQKDAYIAELRQQLTAKEGATTRVPETTSKPANKPFFEQVVEGVEAAKRGDFTTYERVMKDFVATQIQETLAPVVPIFMDTAKDRALRVNEGTAPGIREFIGSDAYNTVLKSRPSLKQAIEGAEANPAYSHTLPELYGIAYDISLGRRAASVPAPPAPAATPTPRPTLSTTTSAPPVPAATVTPDLRTRAGIEATIRNLEERGVGSAKITSF